MQNDCKNVSRTRGLTETVRNRTRIDRIRTIYGILILGLDLLSNIILVIYNVWHD
jgi:hypothetical protein